MGFDSKQCDLGGLSRTGARKEYAIVKLEAMVVDAS
jgi:hypothetical protein